MVENTQHSNLTNLLAGVTGIDKGVWGVLLSTLGGVHSGTHSPLYQQGLGTYSIHHTTKTIPTKYLMWVLEAHNAVYKGETVLLRKLGRVQREECFLPAFLHYLHVHVTPGMGWQTAADYFKELRQGTKWGIIESQTGGSELQNNPYYLELQKYEETEKILTAFLADQGISYDEWNNQCAEALLPNNTDVV